MYMPKAHDPETELGKENTLNFVSICNVAFKTAQKIKMAHNDKDGLIFLMQAP